MAVSGKRDTFADRNQEATIQIGGLEPEVNEEMVWELMLQAGPVANVTMPRDAVTSAHSGYCFCEFRSEIDADYAIKIMNMIRLFGRTLKVNKASQDREDQDVGANIFVGNLDHDVDEQLLYTTFSAFGQVLTAKVMYEGDGTPRGFGFVNFATFEASDQAIQSMQGQFLCNKAVHVSYAYKKDPKGEQSGERHGSQAERRMAKITGFANQNPPNMMFASSAPHHKQPPIAQPNHIPQVPTVLLPFPTPYPSIPVMNPMGIPAGMPPIVAGPRGNFPVPPPVRLVPPPPPGTRGPPPPPTRAPPPSIRPQNIVRQHPMPPQSNPNPMVIPPSMIRGPPPEMLAR